MNTLLESPLPTPKEIFRWRNYVESRAILIAMVQGQFEMLAEGEKNSMITMRR
jgi:hypothetical protein